MADQRNSDRNATDAHQPSRSTLVGRERELTTLQQALDSTVSGRGQLVLIGGEAGIGKTTLVRWLTTRAAGRDALTLSGTCYDLETTSPYGPWIEILRAYLDCGRSPAPPDELIDPEAIERLGGTVRLFEVASRFFLDVAVQQPLVLVLEDQHWADQPSLEFLRFLVRQIHTAPILVVVTYRDVELTPRQPLYRLLPQLVRESQAIRILVRRFDRQAIEQFVTARYDLAGNDRDRLVTYLDRYAEGNPFFTEELLITLEHDQFLRETPGAENGHWVLSDLSDVKIPPLVRQFISDSFMRLSEDIQRHLQVAAVIGLEIPLDLWLEVVGATNDELALVIEQALDRRLIEEAPSHGSVRFRHTLIRQALYESLILPLRQQWHRRVGEVLATHGNPDPEIIAHHFLQASDPRAADWLIRSGEVAEQRYAWLAAAERFEEAERLLRNNERRMHDRAWLLYRASQLHRRSTVDRSLMLLAKANEIATSIEDQLLSALITVYRGLLHCLKGELTLGLAELETGVNRLEEGDWSSELFTGNDDLVSKTVPDPRFQRGILINWLAIVGRFHEALSMGEAFVSEHQPPTSTVDTLVRYEDFYDAYIGLAQCYIADGRPEKARSALVRAREGYLIIERLPWVYFQTEINYLKIFSLDQRAERSALVEMLNTVWQRSLEAINPDLPQEYRQAKLLYLRGDWRTAEASTISTMRHSASETTLNDALIVAGLLALHRGRIDRVQDLVRAILPDGVATEPGTRPFTSTVEAQQLAAYAEIEAGNLEAAACWIEANERLLDWSRASAARPRLEVLRSRFELARGNVDQAIEHAERALDLAGQPRQPIVLLAAHRSLASAGIAGARYEEASQHLDEAHRIAIACETPYERALVQLDQVELAIATGRRSEAESLLQETREIFEQLDARPALSRSNVLEERLTSEAAPAAPATSLSPRELEVLRLVIDGYTDREVADELHISPRTVGNHVANILNKLGVNSRAAAAAEAVRQGLV